MPVVNLPPGCSSLRFSDGSTYQGRPGGAVSVSEDHARDIDRLPGNGTAGLVTGRPGHHLGTKKGRWCGSCAFLAQAWSRECPKCGRPTVPEDEMPAPAPSSLPSACMPAG